MKKKETKRQGEERQRNEQCEGKDVKHTREGMEINRVKGKTKEEEKCWTREKGEKEKSELDVQRTREEIPPKGLIDDLDNTKGRVCFGCSRGTKSDCGTLLEFLDEWIQTGAMDVSGAFS